MLRIPGLPQWVEQMLACAWVRKSQGKPLYGTKKQPKQCRIAILNIPFVYYSQKQDLVLDPSLIYFLA